MPPSPPSPQLRADFDYIALTSLVLVSWEILVHLFQDFTYLRTPRLYRRPVMWAYFLQRYCAFAVVLSETLIRIGHPSNCYAAGLVSLIAGGVFVLPSISLIYLYRVLAIWNKKPIIKWILIVLWVVLFGASMTAPFSQSAGNLPTGGCTVTRSEVYTPASFIANAVFDGAVFLLTVIKLGANRRQYKNFRSPVQTLLLQDGILYFAISVAVGITDIIFLEAVKSPVIASTVIPLHIALTSIMTTRLVNNVFKVITSESSGQGYISGNNTSTIRIARSPRAAMSDTLNVSDYAKNSTPFLPMFTIGSGVGTEVFDDVFGKEENAGHSHDDLERVVAIGPSKGMIGTQNGTYAVPMQVRTKSPGSQSSAAYGVRVDKEQTVSKDQYSHAM